MGCKIIVAEGVKAIQAGENPRFIEEKLLLLIHSKKRSKKSKATKKESEAEKSLNTGKVVN